MPCSTSEDHALIFAEIMDLKSFNQKLGQPKVSNWFAWTKMASEQMREFYATKCVFGSVYAGDAEPDPDDVGGKSICPARTRRSSCRQS